MTKFESRAAVVPQGPPIHVDRSAVTETPSAFRFRTSFDILVSTFVLHNSARPIVAHGDSGVMPLVAARSTAVPSGVSYSHARPLSPCRDRGCDDKQNQENNQRDAANARPCASD